MIFVNYRRDDSRAIAGRLHDRLAQAFGRKNVFMDVDNIPPGVDFVSHLNNHVATCEVFLAVIGPNWLYAKNEDGDRRIHTPEDFVAVEIAAALARDIRVIPVLVDGTRMPKVGDLPEVLKPLVRRQAIELRHDQFGRDAEALIGRIREARPAKRTMILRWRDAAGIAATFLLLGSIWLLQARMPTSLPSAVQPVATEVVKPPDQPEKVGTATIQAVAPKEAALDRDLRPPAEVVKPPSWLGTAFQVMAAPKEAALDQDSRPLGQAETVMLNDIQSGRSWLQRLGLVVSTGVNDELRSKYKIKDRTKGVVITAVDPKSSAAEQKLAEGDVIVRIGDRPVSYIDDVGHITNEWRKNGWHGVDVYVSKRDGKGDVVVRYMTLD